MNFLIYRIKTGARDRLTTGSYIAGQLQLLQHRSRP